ncbi:MAG: phosphoribosylaminoimidazolesuccinocarboxamide synthase [Candidatus Omnitrophica bacterium]|nr:phosphoribosylaminoimidazolesuccinocarboxamide synthase [Candidatus Omnitrophota bacterium]
MTQGETLYEGKAKILYATDDPALVIQYFKDDATAFNAQKRGTILDKGVCNNRISSALFVYLERQGVATHFVRQLDDRSMLVKRLQIVPLEVTVRNITAGGMAKLLGIDEGMILQQPVFEWHYKSDALNDPLINDDHILAMGWATASELAHIRAQSLKVNEALQAFFHQRQIDLVDFKLEFGRCQRQGVPAALLGNAKQRESAPDMPRPQDEATSTTILLGDEISPDTMRLWEHGSRRKLDKDRFRRDLGSVEEAYQEVLRRVLGSQPRIIQEGADAGAR